MIPIVRLSQMIPLIEISSYERKHVNPTIGFDSEPNAMILGSENPICELI